MMELFIIHSYLITLNCPICVGYKVGYHLELCNAKTFYREYHLLPKCHKYTKYGI